MHLSCLNLPLQDSIANLAEKEDNNVSSMSAFAAMIPRIAVTVSSVVVGTNGATILIRASLALLTPVYKESAKMRSPGFTAQASLYTTSECYQMPEIASRREGRIHAALSRPLTRCDYCINRCYSQYSPWFFEFCWWHCRHDCGGLPT